MKKISYRPVYNRKKKLNAQGTALLQVEAYLNLFFDANLFAPRAMGQKKKTDYKTSQC